MGKTDVQRFAVIGLGRFGESLAHSLMAAGAEVIGIDCDASVIERLRDEVTLAVRLDSTEVDAMRAQGIDSVDAAVVGIGQDFEAAALTVATLKVLPTARIIARAQTETQARVLASIGADEVVRPEKESATRWAHRLTMPSLSRYVELGEGHSLVYITAPTPFQHKTLAQLSLRHHYGVNLVAIRRTMSVRTGSDDAVKTSQVISVPDADTTILPDDVLILVGSNESLGELPHD